MMAEVRPIQHGTGIGTLGLACIPYAFSENGVKLVCVS
jgi:hypothetical protein